jgi:hypothetical protein
LMRLLAFKSGSDFRATLFGVKVICRARPKRARRKKCAQFFSGICPAAFVHKLKPDLLMVAIDYVSSDSTKIFAR